MRPIKELDTRALGLQIAQYRTVLKLKREDLAKASGYSQSHIADMENGKGSKLNLTSLEKIASVLGVSLDELLKDSLQHYQESEKTAKIMRLVDSFNEEQTEIFIWLANDYANMKFSKETN